MADFTYPSNDFQRRANLIALLGTHWNNVYRGQGVTESFLFARAQEEVQSYLDLVETVDSISRQSVPVFHRDNWYLLELKESDLNNAPFEYEADGKAYDDGVQYGQQEGSQWSTWTLPTDFAVAHLITNRILSPSVTYSQGLDFFIENGEIKFNVNPFSDTRIPKREVYKSAVVTDRTIGLWVYRGEFDLAHIATHFGFIIDVIAASSEAYRDFVNAILDAFAQGTAAKHIDLALSALTGISVVIEAQEVVEHVLVELDQLTIITDLNVYRFQPTATPIVSVDDTVYAGDRLTDGFEVIEFRDGTIPASLKAVHMGDGFIGAGFLDGIGFTNKTVPLEVTSDANGITRVEFEVGGFPNDVEAFWDTVHARGIAGTTLARLLDVRGTTAVTEPTAASLPATVNPLEFLAENLLRFHTCIIRVNVQETAGGFGFDNARLLRRIVPPWTALILLFELSVIGEVVDPTQSSSTPGVTGSLTSFIGGEPFWSSDTVDPSVFVSESVLAYVVKGACE